jgi:two-component system chemotaxis response regulator CheB
VGYDIVVVGTSWGGLAALRELLAGLPGDFALPVIVVQHRHRESGAMLTGLLQDHTALRVCEVDDKTPIVAGTVHVAPADYHLLVDRGFLSLSMDEPVAFSRPSIDVTFVSVADVYGDRAVGVVLTGANADGSRGLRRIVDRGGLALVQLPSTAESPAMPAAALRVVPEARALTLHGIAEALAALSPPAERGARR